LRERGKEGESIHPGISSSILGLILIIEALAKPLEAPGIRDQDARVQAGNAS